jgi:hypothetical protein
MGRKLRLLLRTCALLRCGAAEIDNTRRLARRHRRVADVFPHSTVARKFHLPVLARTDSTTTVRQCATHYTVLRESMVVSVCDGNYSIRSVFPPNFRRHRRSARGTATIFLTGLHDDHQLTRQPSCAQKATNWHRSMLWCSSDATLMHLMHFRGGSLAATAAARWGRGAVGVPSAMSLIFLNKGFC